MGSLSNLYISQSYQSLIHLGTNNTASANLIELQDGLGNSIGVAVNTNGDLFLSGSLTASLQQGYLYVGDSTGKTTAFATSSLVSNVNTSSLVTTASFNAYTASNDSKVNQLINATSSYAISSSVAAVDASQQSQINSLIAATGSYVTSTITASSLVTASFSGNTLTFTKGDSSTFGVVIPDISGSTINTGSFATTGSNNFNGGQIITGSLAVSGAVVVTGIIAINAGGPVGYLQTDSIFARSGSLTLNGQPGSVIITNFMSKPTIIQTNTEITGALNLTGNLTASLQQGFVLVGNASGRTTTVATSSFGTTIDTGSFTTTSSFNSYTSSTNIRLNNLETTSASVNISISNLNSTTASQAISITNLNTFSASALVSITNLNSATSSYVTESETASFARTNVDNNFSANQTFTNITATSASITYLTTLYETASVIYSSGSNQFGDELTDIQTLSGSVKVQGSLTVNGTPVQTSSVDISALNQATASLQSFTQSAQISINALNTNSASVNTSISALNTFTASQSTASLVTSITELNTFSASTLVSISNLNSTTASLNTSVTNINSATASLFDSASLALVTASFDTGTRNLTFTKGNNTTFAVNIPDVSGSAGDFVTTSSFNAYTQSNDQRVSSLETNSASVNISISNINSTTASLNTFSASALVSISNLNASSASQQISIDNLNTNSASVNTSITNINSATASLFTSASLALVTASFDTGTRNLTFTKGNTTQFSVNIPDVSGSTINTGSFATTGSNSFTGIQTFVDGTNFSSLVPTSGSLMLVAKSFTSASAHLSSSFTNSVNLIFKNNNNTADTIISGSNNLFVNPAAPTAGYKRYIGGSGNIMLNASTVPLISGSMVFSPIMTNNYFGGNATTLTMRGPVSASTWTFAGNSVNGTINIGNAGVSAERLTAGLTITANIIAGSLTAFANQTAITSSATTANANIIVGGVTLTLSSSAAGFSNNIVNDNAFTLINQFSSGSLGLGLPVVNQNTIGGSTNTFYITGSQLVAGTGPSLNQNFIFGQTNILFANASDARVSGSIAYMSSLATGLMGQRLIASGSSNVNDLNSFGSVFVGRFNANDGIKNKTSDVVFAVGTGISGSGNTGRKTGFLIDSGSNSYFEGTLNVSGSTSLTGSLTIQSGSSFFANGNKQFNVGAFQSNINQSGSANVSQSMNFEVTDISSGVSIVSNSRITLANSGTYNIQFSAQILADTGADDVYIWLKKNGTNVAASAGHVVLANNEELIAAWNYVVDAAASDYFELVWQNTNGDALLLAETATGNIPSIPSIILTVTQVR